MHDQRKKYKGTTNHLQNTTRKTNDRATGLNSSALEKCALPAPLGNPSHSGCFISLVYCIVLSIFLIVKPV